ncbi:helix-turn-helix domain-containing protein [Nocardioides alcanivorans]|uniref:helix-turn-helix domain-containing protein n=1 Tax=Nocardioides alcanivorans TaxID=2897352 RepID=UPI001F1F5552|nr:helix-turn-helix transcriptional regulator [Nocardioides alcanivorans]
MTLFRRLLGEALRAQRMERGLTLREVSADARVSLGYISEIERGQKEASSELLASLCGALEMPLSLLLHNVSQAAAIEEQLLTVPATTLPVRTGADVVASAA